MRRNYNSYHAGQLSKDISAVSCLVSVHLVVSAVRVSAGQITLLAHTIATLLERCDNDRDGVLLFCCLLVYHTCVS